MLDNRRVASYPAYRFITPAPAVIIQVVFTFTVVARLSAVCLVARAMLSEERFVPFFFDLSSLIPTVERNPFEPVVVPDEVPVVLPETEIPAEPIVDTGLPLPSYYNFDLMRALVQDPFRLFVYWQLKDNPYDRLAKIFPAAPPNSFHTVLKLIDETNSIAVFFDAAFGREYWFSVFPNRRYRVELGLRSERYGYIKLLSSQSVQTPRGGPSDQEAPQEEFRIEADQYLEVLRESHLVPERAYTLDGLLPGHDDELSAARNTVWESLPTSFRRLMQVIGDIQAGRDYDRWWERLGQEELADIVREFLAIIAEMGDGELGYMLLLRYLPELLRRSILAEAATTGDSSIIEWQIDKPVTLYLAEQLGQAASEHTQPPAAEHQAGWPSTLTSPSSLPTGLWLPSMQS